MIGKIFITSDIEGNHSFKKIMTQTTEGRNKTVEDLTRKWKGQLGYCLRIEVSVHSYNNVSSLLETTENNYENLCK